MEIFLFLIFLLFIRKNVCEKKTELFLFTHAMSPSHLSVVFNVAEKIKNSTSYDIRWPMVDSVANFPTRKNFKKIIFPDALVLADKIQKMVNTGIKENSASLTNLLRILPPAVKFMSLSCFLNETNGVRRNRSPLVISSTMSVMLAKLPEEMNVLDRTLNILAHNFFLIIFIQLKIVKFFIGQENPNLFRPQENALLLSNNHKFIDWPTVKTHGLVEIGNYEENEMDEIDQDLKNFIENKNYDGFVIFSMSTYTNDGELEDDIIENFARVFDKFSKIAFVWRINEIPENLQKENIKIVKWIPQRTIFAHPKAKAVISHCGQNSFLEAVHAGLPIICIPTMGDQFPNSQRAKYRDFGLMLSSNNLTETTIFDALQSIVQPIFKTNALKFKEMLQFERKNGFSSNIEWWIEWRFRHEQKILGKFLFPHGSHMGLVIYYNLDWAILIKANYVRNWKEDNKTVRTIVCEWYGTSPLCSGACPKNKEYELIRRTNSIEIISNKTEPCFDSEYKIYITVRNDTCDFGAGCISGDKVLCCIGHRNAPIDIQNDFYENVKQCFLPKFKSGYTSQGAGEYTDSSDGSSERAENAQRLGRKKNVMGSQNFEDEENNGDNLRKSPQLYERVKKFVSTHGWIFYHTEEDVKKFFEGLNIVQMFLHDLQGFNNNICFIEFENENEVEKALEKDGQVVDGSVRIIRNEFEKLTVTKLKILLAHNEQNKLYAQYGFVAMAGMTVDCTENEIREFFIEIVFGVKPRKQQPYRAYLRLGSKEDELNALEFNGKDMNKRFTKVITLTGVAFQIKKKEMANPTKANANDGVNRPRKQMRDRFTQTNDRFYTERINQLEAHLHRKHLELARTTKEMERLRKENEFLRGENELLKNIR